MAHNLQDVDELIKESERAAAGIFYELAGTFEPTDQQFKELKKAQRKVSFLKELKDHGVVRFDAKKFFKE